MLTTIPCLAQGCVRLPGEAEHSEGYRGLVARWSPINQGPGGGFLYDSAGHGVGPGALAAITPANWESSQYGSVINFPLATSRIIVLSNALVAPLQITCRMVFRTLTPWNGATMTLLHRGAGADADYYLRHSNLGLLTLSFNNAGWSNHFLAGAVAAGVWYDLMFTIGNGLVTIWINSVLRYSAAEARAMPQSAGNLLIGSTVGGIESFQGKLALVEMWNYCLPKPLSPDPHFLARTA